MKRYTLQAIFFVPTEDDDGNIVVAPTKKKKDKLVFT